MIDWDGLVLGPTIDVFGEPVTYKPVSGSPFAIVGVFDEAYQELSMIDDSVATNTRIPVLGIRMSDFTTPPAQNDKLSVASVGKTFIVKDVREDGHGWAKLMLNFVSSP